MRFDDRFVRATAKMMLGGDAARIWTYVSDEIREALLDRAVMDFVRSAVNTLVTPAELVEFRERLVVTLAEGVFIGKVKRVLMLDSARSK